MTLDDHKAMGVHLGQDDQERRAHHPRRQRAPLEHGLLHPHQCRAVSARDARRADASRQRCASGRHRAGDGAQREARRGAASHRAPYAGPYLELFGRKPVPRWTVWGNEIKSDKFEAAE
jgi:hypothetical protein